MVSQMITDLVEKLKGVKVEKLTVKKCNGEKV